MEIERKFLVKKNWRPSGTGIRYKQGYLCKEPEKTVRVRISPDTAWLSIKGAMRGISRPEYEYTIPPDEGRELLALCQPYVVDKTRYRINHAGMIWEVDVFHGANQGLILAEIELEDEQQTFLKPDWVGMDVSHDKRYFNSYLARHPFNTWGE